MYNDFGTYVRTDAELKLYVFCIELLIIYDLFFFFSSRRRHTRFDCDWSSDVCSSDLPAPAVAVAETAPTLTFLAGSPLGYSGMVKVGAVSATATAGSGPGASGPTVTGAPVSVQLWNGSGYTSVNVTPGAAPPATDPTAHAALSVLGTSVVMDATVHWNKAVTSQASSGGAITDASASLTNWLWVDLHVVMTTLGVPVADVDLHIDYGRIAATAGYQPAS